MLNTFRRFDRRAGFTTIELVVVICIVGIVSAMTLPKLKVDRWKLDGATRAAVAEFNYASQTAVSLQHDVRVSVDTTNKMLIIHEDRNNDGTITTSERIRGSQIEGVSFGRSTAAALPMGASPVNFTLTAGLPAVTFHRDGSASQEGGFYLRSVRDTTPSAVRAIVVTRSTGRTSAWTSASGSWGLLQ
jgi:Tfp pilus assembly protein FimT